MSRSNAVSRGGVKPREHAPELTVELVGGGRWRLDKQRPKTFTMVVFYRGLQRRSPTGRLRSGIFDRLRVGFGIDTETMRRWGLFVSEGHDGEPAWFSEPGLFLISPDGAVYYEALNSMPWGRPRLDDVLNGLDFVISAGYPARGEA